MSTLNRTFSVKNGIDVANTVLIDSERNLVNVGNVTPTGNNTQSLGSPDKLFKDLYLGGGTLYLGQTSLSATGDQVIANTFLANVSFLSGGLNVLNQANTARTTANDAYGQANTARNTANAAYGQANDAFSQANTARDTANGAYAQANGAYAQANGAYAQANGAFAQANGAYAQANGAYAQANGAYNQANSAANTVRVYANGGSILSDKFLNFINTSSVQVTVSDSGDGNANIAFRTTGAAVADAYAQANAAYSQANAAYDTANNKIENLYAAGAIYISSGETDNVISYTVNVNTANTTTVGVTKLVDTIDSDDSANAATANAVKTTYDFANTKLPLAGGTVSGDLTVQGNLFLTGNATYINTTSIIANDSIIILASNNIADAVDIGFLGHYSDDGGTTNLHAGLIRHASDNVFYVFDGYGYEPGNNVVDVASANLAWLRANVNAASLLINGESAATQANLTLAHNQANTARDTANDAYAQANTARDTANDAYAQANTAYGQANVAYGQANAAYSQANTAYDQANTAYGQANTARTTANDAYAQANTGYGQANAAYGQANAAYGQANVAYDQANAAYDRANTKVYKSGDTMTGQLTINTSGLGLSVGNAAVTYKLTVGSLNVTTNTVTTIGSGQVVLDTFPATDLASAKYFVQANSGTDYHTTEVVLVQDATNVWITEYGSIQTGPSLGSFSADINSGSVRLLFNATNAVNTIRSVRYGIAT